MSCINEDFFGLRWMGRVDGCAVGYVPRAKIFARKKKQPRFVGDHMNANNPCNNPCHRSARLLQKVQIDPVMLISTIDRRCCSIAVRPRIDVRVVGY